LAIPLLDKDALLALPLLAFSKKKKKNEEKMQANLIKRNLTIRPGKEEMFFKNFSQKPVGSSKKPKN